MVGYITHRYISIRFPSRNYIASRVISAFRWQVDHFFSETKLVLIGQFLIGQFLIGQFGSVSDWSVSDWSVWVSF